MGKKKNSKKKQKPEPKSPIRKQALSKAKEATKKARRSGKPDPSLKPAFSKPKPKAKPTSKGLAADAMAELRAKLHGKQRQPTIKMIRGVKHIKTSKGGRLLSPRHQSNIDANFVTEAAIDATERVPRLEKAVKAYEGAVKDGTLKGKPAKDAAARLIEKLDQKTLRIKVGMDKGQTLPANTDILHTRQTDPNVFTQKTVKGVQQAFDTEGRKMAPVKGIKRVQFINTNQARKFATQELPKAFETVAALRKSVQTILKGLPAAMLLLNLPDIAQGAQTAGEAIGRQAGRTKLAGESLVENLKARAGSRTFAQRK